MLAMRIRRLVVAVMCVAFASSCSLSADRRAQTPTSRSPSRPPVPTTTHPTTTTTGPPFLYRVRQGDTLTALAAKFRVSVSVIMAHSHLTNPDHLREGQVLRIPEAPPLVLTITPHQGRAGQAFRFTLTGAEPSETITFTTVSPTGRDIGAPHTTLDGTVIATYHTSVGDPAGIRTVLAAGNMGTSLTAQFVVTVPTSTAQ
ncbi:MAG TPA: LysM peptidoglycan-binding domain-containing protein [Acidimicrobiia bacterium]|nr:LysM peptidoglycan-binding domain-containing protein [Acidimicrobiia bacterium]